MLWSVLINYYSVAWLNENMPAHIQMFAFGSFALGPYFGRFCNTSENSDSLSLSLVNIVQSHVSIQPLPSSRPDVDASALRAARDMIFSPILVTCTQRHCRFHIGAPGRPKNLVRHVHITE